jgi:hypothetical protein
VGDVNADGANAFAHAATEIDNNGGGGSHLRIMPPSGGDWGMGSGDWGVGSGAICGKSDVESGYVGVAAGAGCEGRAKARRASDVRQRALRPGFDAGRANGRNRSTAMLHHAGGLAWDILAGHDAIG